MAVTLPAVIVLLDFFHYDRKISVILQDTALGFLVSLIFGYIAINAQKESSAMREGEYYSLLDHAAIGFMGWFHYLQKLIIPYPLSAVYTMPLKDPRTMLFPQIFYICLGAFPVVNALLLWKGNNKVRLMTLAFSASVAHVLFAPVGSAMAADRYMYVPSLFFCWAVAELVTLKTGALRNSLVMVLIVVVVPLFSWLTIERTKVWASNFVLFSDVARQYPHDLLANNNIGLHYVKAKEFDKAREAYTRVITHYPMDYTGYFNMGVSYNLQEKGREAMYYFGRVFELNPGYKDLNSQYGVAALFARSNDTAVFFLKRALELNPDVPDHYFNLALAYSRVGLLDDSDQMYEAGMKKDPERINSYLNRAYNDRKRNNTKGEEAWIDLAVSKGMDRGLALRNMGIMIGEDEDYVGAKYYFEKAIQLDPKDAEALYNLAISFEKLGDLNTAIPIYIQAARLDYGSAKELLDRNKVPY
jgi:tetratricopeptide (TPR) repeat protein